MEGGEESSVQVGFHCRVGLCPTYTESVTGNTGTSRAVRDDLWYHKKQCWMITAHLFGTEWLCTTAGSLCSVSIGWSSSNNQLKSLTGVTVTVSDGILTEPVPGAANWLDFFMYLHLCSEPPKAVAFKLTCNPKELQSSSLCHHPEYLLGILNFLHEISRCIQTSIN